MVFDVLTGFGLGLSIGLISGLMTLLILRDAFAAPNPNPSWWQRTFGQGTVSGVKFIAKLALIPVFFLGGKWGGAIMLTAEWPHVLPFYMFFLGLSYFLIMVGPLVRLIIKIMKLMK
jgi:hypothetical protein